MYDNKDVPVIKLTCYHGGRCLGLKRWQMTRTNDGAICADIVTTW
jgi:hypothetical protein